MIYSLAAACAIVLFIFLGWRSRQNRSRAPEEAMWLPTAALGLHADDACADVGASVSLALKRLLPVMTSHGIRADVAVRPALRVSISGASLTDLLEELLTVAIHHAQASRLLVTAVGRGTQVAIGVTDNGADADPAMRIATARSLSERVALQGGALEIEVRPSEGGTMTLRLAAADGQPDRISDVTEVNTAAPKSEIAAQKVTNGAGLRLTGAH